MIKSMANDIKDRFSNIGVDLSADDIESRLDKLITKFKVPKDEARRSVINFYLKENKIQSEDFYKLSAQASEIVSIKDIKEENQWISVKGKIVQLWDALHDSISQVGLIGDETGTIKFTKWKSANLPELVEGKSYLLSNVVTDVWQGRYSIVLNRNTEINELEEDIKVAGEFTGEESPIVNIGDIMQENQWISLRVKVVQLWDALHESISQVGLIGDETGTIRFIKWKSDDLPDLIEGKSYFLKNLITRKWQDRYDVQLSGHTEIEELEQDIEVGSVVEEFSGVMVSIYEGSGLIKRCPECNRALAVNECSVHGTVEGVPDLRIRAVIDNGDIAQEVLLNCSVTESLTGYTLDDAMVMAETEMFGYSIVLEKFKEQLIGRYYTLKGSRMDRSILVESIWQEYKIDETELKELIKEAEAV